MELITESTAYQTEKGYLLRNIYQDNNCVYHCYDIFHNSDDEIVDKIHRFCRDTYSEALETWKRSVQGFPTNWV